MSRLARLLKNTYVELKESLLLEWGDVDLFN